MTTMMTRSIQIGVLTSVFATGYLCGSILPRSAGAQMGELGGAVGVPW